MSKQSKKSKKEIRKTLHIPIYDCDVSIVVTKEFDEAVLEAGYKEDCTDSDAVTLHYPNKPKQYCVVFRKGSASYGNIAHEALHLVYKISHSVGIEYDVNNQEPLTYLMGFIVDGMHQIINSYEKSKY